MQQILNLLTDLAEQTSCNVQQILTLIADKFLLEQVKRCGQVAQNIAVKYIAKFYFLFSLYNIIKDS